MIVTEHDRELARREQAEEATRDRMPDAAKIKLREKNDRNRRERLANAELIREFQSRTQTVETVMDWMYRIRPVTTNIRKRAVKAFHFLLNKKPNLVEINDLLFFGELSPEEEGMPLAKILDRYLPATEVIEPDSWSPDVEVQALRYCALGKRCLRSYNNRGHQVTGEAKYCCAACRARANRLGLTGHKIAGLASRNRINTGEKHRVAGSEATHEELPNIGPYATSEGGISRVPCPLAE